MNVRIDQNGGNNKAMIPIPKTIRVTESFVSWANDQTYTRTRENADALLLEYTLIRDGIVKPPFSWRHDFIWNDLLIDAKEIDKYFNIHRGKTAQYMESVVFEELTHFFFYQTDRDRTRPLVPGEYVHIKEIGLLSARYVLKSRIESRPDRLDTEAFLSIGQINAGIT